MAGTERSQSTRRSAGDPSGHSLTLVVTPLIAVPRPPSTPSTPGAAFIPFSPARRRRFRPDDDIDPTSLSE